MRKIGLTGGIATGKSSVLKIFQEEGIKTINTDKIAKELTQKGKKGYERIIEVFGRDILKEDGEIDRKKLAEIVFSDQSKRKQLERILHPLILERLYQQLLQIEKEHPCHPVVIEIPLLFEVGAEKDMDITVLVYAPEEIQIKRLMERDKISEEEAVKRLKSQIPIEEKRKMAHVVIDNSGDFKDTRLQVRNFIAKIKSKDGNR